MYNYRQHDISEATARALESADARIDALEARIREIYRDSKEWYDEEAESLYEALDKAWDAFRWARNIIISKNCTTSISGFTAGNTFLFVIYIFFV